MFRQLGLEIKIAAPKRNEEGLGTFFALVSYFLLYCYQITSQCRVECLQKPTPRSLHKEKNGC